MIIQNRDISGKKLNETTSRKVLIAGQELMLAEFHFAKGGVGEPHRHESHEQVGYVVKGSFEILVGNEKRIVKQGDCYHAPKNTLHGVVSLEDDSIIVDAFTPIRQDFL
ncbi:MAG: cupin domain-containing protein [Veillonellales bacterium]